MPRVTERLGKALGDLLLERIRQYRRPAESELTTYPEATHDAWTETYENDALYEWFLSHSSVSS